MMIIVGTRDQANRPSIARAVGARAINEEIVEVIVSAWQWPEAMDNLAANGQAAVTFARPADYVSYQLKGSAQLRAVDSSDLEQSRRYRANIYALFGGLGLRPELVSPWLADRELTVARLRARGLHPDPRAKGRHRRGLAHGNGCGMMPDYATSTTASRA
ncbi:hypothetical protein [Cupriavidus necator]